MRLLTAILILVFASVAWSQGLDKRAKNELQKAEKSDNNADKNKSPTHTPVTITVIPTITATTKPDHQAKNEEKESKPWEALTGFSTLALAFITMGLAYFTLELWRSTGNLVKGAEDTAKKQLRAYIGIQDQIIRRVPDGRYQAVITIVNSGRTPAHNVRRILKVGVFDAEHTDFDTSGLIGQMPMAPNSQYVMRKIVDELKPDDIPKINNPESGIHVFMWGRIEYKDIYKVQQHVNFRFISREVITAYSNEGLASSGGWALQPTENGNEAT